MVEKAPEDSPKFGHRTVVSSSTNFFNGGISFSIRSWLKSSVQTKPMRSDFPEMK